MELVHGHMPWLLRAAHQSAVPTCSSEFQGAYFDLVTELCSPCNVFSLECEDGSPISCTVLPPMRFLLAASKVDVTGVG